MFYFKVFPNTQIYQNVVVSQSSNSYMKLVLKVRMWKKHHVNQILILSPLIHVQQLFEGSKKQYESRKNKITLKRPAVSLNY